ncbi:aminotransferase class III-fold pyridoxal phosphate-dependent enzyme [Arthrobacter sp. I2-34]|uniref:Aminotransferase class III-fold pyridoxal phosphate-dependent enzyme n=1 Tax=Arthrobacter hankyongi TaxID=2904801 RepID=A0ABS9L885_9MICC|nr:aminotransferase class III-fold pyridoxal phosphate-dependent enzyme [Arthrobacter hankyongi]MCG2622891.1 aminotransferase class III-fold pyridoxal phosphate-dependent enzyme [Arthrobacter hankyongi]
MSNLSREDALALARRALDSFGISASADIEFVKHRENVVFRVSDAGGSYALRIHRLGHRSDAEVHTENAYMAALGTAGLPVPEVVPSLDGRLFAVVPDEQGRGHHVDVQRWVEDSVPLGDAAEAWAGKDGLSAEAFEQLGELCGRLHTTVRDLGRIPGYSRQAWDADGLAGQDPLWGDPRRLAETEKDRATIAEALAGIRRTLKDLGTGPDVYGVIHADFTPENVLTSQGRLTLIDFDDFGEGWWLFDLATVLFWYHRHPRANEYREALLQGYERHAKIPEGAAEALNALVLARGLTYLGWAADRPGDETSAFLRAEVLPVVLDLCRGFIGPAPSAAPAPLPDRDRQLLARRAKTIGPYSPLFYDRPRHFVSGDGVWLTDADGQRYLDAYNNVPHVGHANPRVADAVCAQLNTYNVHTRYLSEPVVDYAEQLLATFDAPLDRVYFTNSGSEANELALRIARHRTGRSGVIVTDHSYHGNTIALASLTTGLTVSEPFGQHVRTINIPDLDDPRRADPGEQLAAAFAEIDQAIASLEKDGHGLAALLIEPAFSTEGLPRLPEGYLPGLVERIRAAGGLVIADEVQAGLGRLGDVWWGHQATGISPDMVTLGKPLGNGYPLGGVVTTQAVLEDFSSANMYFNTFAGTPAAAAAGKAVLDELKDRDLLARTGGLGRHVAGRLRELAARQPRVAAAKGRGLFFGLALVDEDGNPDSPLAKRLVEALVRERILISRIGPNDNVLKIRPPLVIERDELDHVIDTLDSALAAETRTVGTHQ